MKKIFLIVILSVPFLAANANANDEIIAFFKRTNTYSQFMSRNLGCSPSISKILVNSEVKENKNEESYLLIATNGNCRGSFRYEFMRAVTLIKKISSSDKILIKERSSDLSDVLDRAIMGNEE